MPLFLFVVLVFLLLLLVLAVLLRPLLRAQKTPAQGAIDQQAQTSLAVLREEQALLVAERDDGALDQDGFESALAELQARVLDETQHAAPSAAVAAASERPALFALVISLPLLAFLLYAFLGQPAALDPAARVAAHEPPMFSADQRNALLPKVDGLVERLDSEPQDTTGWLMLARAYFLLGDADRARAAWALLGERIPQDVEVLAIWAQLLATIDGGDFSGTPDALLERALALAPMHLDTLMLASASAFAQGQDARFKGYWKKILAQIPEQHWDGLLAQIPPEDPARKKIEAVINAQRTR